MKWCTPVQTLPAPEKICSPKKDYKTNNHVPCPHSHADVKNTSVEYVNYLNKKICSLKTDYETNNHLPCPRKKYVVQKQATKQIITCRAQQNNM